MFEKNIDLFPMRVAPLLLHKDSIVLFMVSIEFNWIPFRGMSPVNPIVAIGKALLIESIRDEKLSNRALLFAFRLLKSLVPTWQIMFLTSERVFSLSRIDDSLFVVKPGRVNTCV